VLNGGFVISGIVPWIDTAIEFN